MAAGDYHEGISIRVMTDKADKKLYCGKRHGKNQVVSHLSEDEQRE